MKEKFSLKYIFLDEQLILTSSFYNSINNDNDKNIDRIILLQKFFLILWNALITPRIHILSIEIFRWILVFYI